ncbi:MAG: hypothetical protein WDN01_12415 [Rhizomicrobium sp.]
MISQIIATIGTFFSDPLSASLLLGDVIATLAVGIGIVLETPENPTFRQKSAMALVVIGVIAETICSVWLFGHDAAIISKQQTTIIELETRLAGRVLTKPEYDAIQTLRGKIPGVLLVVEPHCPECLNFSSQIATAFDHAGIKVFANFPETMEGGGGGCVYKSPYSDLTYATLSRGGFSFHSCGDEALKIWRINSPLPVIGVAGDDALPYPVKPYLGPSGQTVP